MNSNNIPKVCTKGGVKIHETPKALDPELFYQNLKSQNKHTGVRVNETGNAFTLDPFEGVSPFQKQQLVKNRELTQDDLYKLDLNLENYDVDDIFNLFTIVLHVNI